MDCNPNSLLSAARCLRCIPSGMQREVQIYLLCQWANNLTPPQEQVVYEPPNVGGQYKDKEVSPYIPFANLAALQAIIAADPFGVVYLDFSGQPITSITGLDTLPNLQHFLCGGSSMVTLDLANCAALRTVAATTCALTFLDVTNDTLLQNLDCSINGSLTSITGMGTCSGLLLLDCSTCDITGTLDVSGLANLTTLNCGTNSNLTGIDLTGCTSLNLLVSNSCALAALDLSPATSITICACNYNAIATITLTGCTLLYDLGCGYNQLAAIDVSTCTSIYSLNCSYNLLVALNVTLNASLVTLGCQGNSIVNLDVSTCPLLQNLFCNDNSLASLIVTGCTLLQTINDESNFLTTLDVSTCSSLNNLNCINNALTTGAGGAVNLILTSILANNPPVGTINLSSQFPAAPPDAGPPDGATAKTTLIGLGWTVTTD